MVTNMPIILAPNISNRFAKFNLKEERKKINLKSYINIMIGVSQAVNNFFLSFTGFNKSYLIFD